MKARHRFEAIGRSYRSRGIPWWAVKRLTNLYALPAFAQSAIARGHLLQGPLAGGSKSAKRRHSFQ
jgi:hypothetical protein